MSFRSICFYYVIGVNVFHSIHQIIFKVHQFSNNVFVHFVLLWTEHKINSIEMEKMNPFSLIKCAVCQPNCHRIPHSGALLTKNHGNMIDSSHFSL